MKKLSRSYYRNNVRNDSSRITQQNVFSSNGGDVLRPPRPRSNSFSTPSTSSSSMTSGTNNGNICIVQNGNSRHVLVRQTTIQTIKRKFTKQLAKIRRKNSLETSTGERQLLPGSSGNQHTNSGNEIHTTRPSNSNTHNIITDANPTKSISTDIHDDSQTCLGGRRYRLSKSEEALDYCEVRDNAPCPENCYVLNDENCTLEEGVPPPPPPPRPPKPESMLRNGHVNEEPPRPPARPKNRAMGPLPSHLERSFASISVDGDSTNRLTIYENPTDNDDFEQIPISLGLSAELAKLPRQPWYWGPLRQQEAEEKLKYLPDGKFLVRDSSDERYLLSLSFNSNGRTLHTRIEYRNRLFSLNDSEGYPSIVSLIENAIRESKDGVFGYMRDYNGVQSFPAKLIEWVSRFKEVRSLQYLCRFVIRERYALHVIPKLPIPNTIKVYVLENKY